MPLEQIERERLLAAASPARAAPPSSRRRARAGGGRRAREVTPQRREVVGEPLADLLAHDGAARQDRRQRGLDRRRDRQERVADQLEPVEQIARRRRPVRPPPSTPASAAAGRPPWTARRATRSRHVASVRTVGGAPAAAGEAVVGEHLVGDQRQPVRRAAGRQRVDVGGRQHRAGRVVRADHDDRPGARRDAGGDGVRRRSSSRRADRAGRARPAPPPARSGSRTAGSSGTGTSTSSPGSHSTLNRKP